MAPTGRPREPSIERTTEYEAFMASLSAYHKARGTTLEAEPRVGSRHADLYRLYNAVVARGGYDVVCTEKLAWRKLGQDFNLGTTNLPALAFSLKSAYYKNLAAYEIATFHKREPPPREILEDISARGADLLQRTLENFKPHGARDSGTLGNGEDSEGGGDELEHKSPNSNKIESEDVTGSAGRYARGLRQAPPQRVLFQPDLTPARAPRQSLGHAGSSQPMMSATQLSVYNSSNPNSNSFTIANYEPKAPVPLTLRPVVTPGNNANLFKERQRMLREAKAAKEGKIPPTNKGMMLPGSGFEGPNIYLRTLQALRSSITAEQDYALHHLVKISHERGDKFRFDAFPGLAEGLVEKALQVSSLFYEVEWDISYSDEGPRNESHVLDGMQSTPDLLRRIQALASLETRDGLETAEFRQRLIKVNEAALTIRNMAMLEENAEYLSRLSPMRDFISIALSLPERAAAVEIRHYALDIAEQLTTYYSVNADDPLYQSLLARVESTDRGSILTALRAISRISMHLEENNRLMGVPLSLIRRVSEWTLLEDEELVHACLDFLYQYTAVVDNVDDMVSGMDVEGLITHLVRLLLYGAKTTEVKKLIRPPTQEIPAAEIPSLPQELLSELLSCEEPTRSACWLRACFEEDPIADITQIALWQAYQSRFVDHQSAGPNRALLPAADFIKNISSSFASASAQVLPGPPPKFIIKGIRPRHFPMNPRGQVYSPCRWRTSAATRSCQALLKDPQSMWEHLLTVHLRAPKRADGKFDLSTTSTRAYRCRWADCRRFQGTATTNLYEIGLHLKTHLPNPTAVSGTTTTSTSHRNPEATVSSVSESSSSGGGSGSGDFETQMFLTTAVDERGDAVGIPLTAVLVLRNLACNLPKVNNKDTEGVGWVRRFFSPVQARLWYVMAHNKPLGGYLADLNATVAAGS